MLMSQKFSMGLIGAAVLLAACVEATAAERHP
jgi:hypothetical protein